MDRRLHVAAAAFIALAVTSGCSFEVSTGKESKKTQKSEKASPSASASPTLNGIDGLPPAEIVDKSAEALRRAPSVRISGTMKKSELDLKMDNEGNCDGNVTQEGTHIKIVKRGAKVWLKPDHAFWVQTLGEEAESTEELLGGRYLLTSIKDPKFGSLASICDISGFADSMDDDEAGETVAKGDRKEVRGTSALELIKTQAGKGPSRLYVARTGQPYPLEIHGEDQGSPAAVTLAEYGAQFTFTTPGPTEAMDVEKLGT
ncbi:hypothetical protein [Streptomyces chryseus]